MQDMNHNMCIDRISAKIMRMVVTLLVMVLAGSNAMAEGETTTSTGVVVRGSVFGGGNAAGVGGNTVVNIEATNCTVQTGVYGGCNTKGVVAGNSTVTITGGKIGDGSTDTETGVVTVTTSANVHGGGYGSETLVQGDVTVNIGKKEGSTLSGSAKLYGDVYGGSAQGLVNATERATAGVYTVTMYDPDPTDEDATLSAKCATKVRLYGGTIYGDLYGGGLGLDADGTENDKAADVYGPVTVDVEGGSVSNVYGCNNALGTPKENVIVNITGGTVTEDVYGGGNLAASERSITVNIKGGTVNRDVYGGGALANTNIGNVSSGYGTTTETISSTATNTTIVNLTSGTVGRDVYGGGLGRKQATGVTAVEAKVYGDVTVKLNETVATDNCKVVRNIFGCNNANGSPQGLVSVLIYKTVDPITTAVPEGQIRYHVKGVFGGGNEAAYNPYNIRTSSNLTGNKAQVTISGCSVYIEKVYGGGNAAPVPEANVAISGAAAIDYVYGGGCGVVDGAVANVGWLNDDDETEYGTGEATTIITAGKINHVFAGSDSHGDIREKAKLNISEDETSSCKTDIAEVYSYGNQATMSCESEVTVGCTTKPIGALYGGAMNADVDHDIVLNINGGNFTRVFGGNNAGGSINGSIKVNIEETSTSCGINIDELYGCGNEAPYSIYGTEKNSSGQWVVKTSGTAEDDPKINLRSFTRIDNVYGGGLGESAVVLGAPTIDINITKAASGYNLGNIYGGGYGANVTGNTNINIGTTSTVNFATIDDDPDTTDDESEKAVVGAHISGDVFGGGYGHETNVTGTATINIGEKKPGTTEGTFDYVPHGASFSSTSSIYGGSALGTVGTTQVNLYAAGTTDNNVIAANVFGGGKGQLYEAAVGTEGQEGYKPAVEAQAATVGTAHVSLYNTTVTGSIYGGCNDNGETTTAVVNLIGGSVGTSGVGDKVFGGGQGHLTTTTNATVNVGSSTTVGSSSIYSNVYGGSALGAVGTAIVNLNKATTLTGHVFGGGMGSGNTETTAATVTTSATVNQNNITLASGKNIYGGCNVNGTAASTTVNLKGGSVTDVFGGGLGQYTSVTGNALVNVGTYENSTISGNPTITGDVYGGSAQGTVNKNETTTTKTTNTTVHLYAGSVGGNVYGGGLGQKARAADTDHGITALDLIEAHVYGDVLVDLNNYGGTCTVAGGIFGCNNQAGSPKGHTTVHIYKTVKTQGSTASYDLAAVYGGGNEADYVPDDAAQSTEVVIEGCDKTSIQNVYGGGNAAAVPATDVWILGTEKIETVFGGGNGERGASYAANVGFKSDGSAYSSGTGKARTQLVAGKSITTVYGGSNSNGDIRGGTWISMPQASEYPGYVENVTSCCDLLQAAHVYGGGKNAKMSSGTNIILGCQPNHWIEEIYAGSQEADVDGDVSLTITSGMFERVFGGNKTSGKLKGSITVNIEETGDCTTPIIIGELYAGGNQAHYSIYGYKANGDPMTAEDLRKELKDNNPGKTAAEIEALFQAAKKDEPQLNVRAFTSIGAIYGGGLSAEMYADPTVSINVVKGSRNATVIGEGQYTPNTGSFHHLPYPAHASGAIGTIGNVFGGGNLATVYGSATVNIGTEEKAYFITEPVHLRTNSSTPMTPVASGDYAGLYEVTVEGANITGNVYGGGNLADVTGNTQVNICAKKSGNDYIAVAEGASKVTIGGNVFGGGQGVADNFYCDKAMVGINGAGADKVNYPDGYPDGNTSVIIGNGTVNGSVYGGGEIGRVEMNTAVTIGIEGGTVTSAPRIKGNVFGAGKGLETHGYAALVRGNPIVTIQGNAKVDSCVYGGGEIASVARYQVVGGVPVALAGEEGNYSGYCTVNVLGNAIIGPDEKMVMHHVDAQGNTVNGSDGFPLLPDDAGHVFAAGKGVLPKIYTYADNAHRPKRMLAYNDETISKINSGEIAYWEFSDEPTNKNIWQYFKDETQYFEFIQTLALATQTAVTVDGNAFVKGSVYGGSQNGLVQYDTHVTIDGNCQIGCGKETTDRHPDAVWGETYPVSEGMDLECASWEYDPLSGAPYDPYARYLYNGKYYYDEAHTESKYAEGGSIVAKDGHTYYGNVFGGGSGSVPYFDTEKGISRYIPTAGEVKRDTYVTISGGHILTNVYGGNEATNVLGTAHVTMTGGTIGVPRTPQQIKDHPVTCYLFGAGKGDQRIFFNKETNVNDAIVKVEGGRIYGSVFGGGEDGHVLRNTEVTIGKADGTGPKIGTVGSTYVDGNVFGGGRGFSGEALTAGNVGGSVDLIINGGTMLGSVYGGGRLASVGYGLYLTTETGYGEIRDDKEYDDPSKPISTTETAEQFFTNGRGHITVTVNGGTIGKEFDSDVEGEHSGNVFGGSMGRLTKLDGSSFDDSHWSLLATAKSTTVNINGGTIKRSVYGGGEMGTVTTNATVNVSGGTIGTENKGGAEFGNVYGGGKGYVDPAGSNYVTAGIIKGNTTVAISGTSQILHNVYGGGAYGSVGEFNYDATTGMPTGRKENTTGGIATITITGGTIGTNGDENGMVFGSSRGDVGAPGEIHDKLAWVYDANVVIGTSGSNDGPQINGSVYGSGENGHTFNDATVNIHGGTIGIVSGSTITTNDNGTPNDTSDDTTYSGAEYPYRGNVYGGGCGTDKYDSNNDGSEDSYNALAGVVYGDTQVTIDGGQVVHNVYGAGAMGSVGLTNATGAIIKDGTTTITISGGKIGVDGTKGDGNVFGAARGDFASTQTHLAQVRSTSVSMSDGTVYGNVYGGGEAGDVGTYVKSADGKTYTWDKISDQEIGSCAVEITGGTVNGHVFGAGKGEANTFTCEKAMVRTATVNISAGMVAKNVYGGGEVGRVDQDSKVTLGVADQAKGSAAPVIAGDVFGAGAGKETHGYSALVRGNAEVIVQGNAKVDKSVYGGGEIAAVGRYGLDSSGMPSTLVSGGECKVTVKGYADIEGNVFGAGEGVDESKKTYTYTTGNTSTMPKRMMTYDPDVYKEGYENPYERIGDYVWEYYPERSKYLKFLQTLALTTDTKLSIEGNARVKGSVYGGSESGFVQRDTEVKIQGAAGTDGSIIDGNIYGGGKGLATFAEAGRVNGGVTIDVSGSTTRGSVFGGGELGVVVGAVKVGINNGTIEKDVYGGGALANTNTNNWNGTTLTETYLEVGGLIAGTSSVVGYYTKSGDNYTLLTEGTASTGTKYYRKVNTTVNLLGGTIKGDAYGGGLGQKKDFNGATTDIAAVVYGDISVTLDGTAFEINKYTDAGYTNVVKSGRVFGCNNLYGSPQGDVTVTVNKTVAGNVSRTPASIKVDGYGKVLLDDTEHYKSTYEVAAVYGGGNLAPYKATGKKTYVIINGCGKTSIETVYGGGNAAAVPEAKVDINGTYEIGAVFGGGNGKDKYKSDAGWVPNPGANIGKTVDGEVIGNGNTTTWIYGGTVHEAYGASNEKGTITGNVLIDVGTVAETDLNYCKLDVGKVVGAGKNADVNGDIITILGCKPDEEIPIYYGGADNANVNGNVELTITSGNFGQVFGGNNVGGIINGHIILNIEEITPCSTPINIKKLYLGGNQAAYSVYGYYVVTQNASGTEGDGSMSEGYSPVLTNDKLTFRVRTSADDPHKPVKTFNGDTKTWEVYTGTYDSTNKKWMWEVSPGVTNDEVYDQPRMNVISCTSIDELFGGGYGVGGDMYADPTVNINMIQGSKASGVPAKMTAKGLTPSDNPNNLGIIGTVYGGGDAADVVGNTTINIGTEPTVDVFKLKVDSNNDPILGEGGAYTWDTATEKKTVLGAYIAGNVYGGGKLADVTGNTYVNICAKEADDASTADVIEYKGVTISGTGYEGVTIAGNVFGGGKGIADSFTCAKAMIGVDKENDGKTDITKESTNKGTRVSIGNGTVNGTVYGGGEIGRVEWNTVVTIGLPMGEGETSAPIIRGNVFGAGKGVEPFGYAALVRGNTFVTVQGNAKIGKSVYGGGEIASVGKYTIASAEYAASHPEIEEGMPYSLANQGSGYCNVIVRGNAEIGPDGMVMNNTTTGKPDDLGHVFGAGKGVLPYENLATTECQTHAGQHHPGRMAPGNVWECYDGNEAKYLSFVETQALATQTDVTIDGNAFVKGSVYGGSENGHVQHDTHVTIAGGQIGAGEGINKRYTDHYGEWPTETESIETSWKECAHWEYTPNDAAPWDPYAIYESEGKYYYDAAHTQYAEGGAKVGKDGHTFYGNVFGGGSGLLPYAPGKWHRAAGSVGGNTQVDIKGGHILTSVYGGNEQTDVGTYKKDSKGALVVPVRGGKCTINMTGGTLGVPRTAADAKAHPVTCYLFGAGKGDQRIFFNTWTNVINTKVNISGTARIYGSTFGGGEDGHVIDNAETNISGTAIIGTTGTSYVDGNVFGGGRGFSGEAQTSGTVGGNVKVNISGGKMLGNIYGGGRLASVGTMFTAPDDPNYGNFVEDGGGKTYGHVAVNISGGIIGNTVGNAESGNVFGGSMGRLTLLDGTTINPIWPKMAQVKEAKVTISGEAVIKRNVYGGGELGTVRDNATVTINGGTVNRDVYGAGYGSKDYETKTKITVKMPKEGVTNPTSASDYDDVSYVFTPMIFAGCVGQNTYVNIAGGKVRKSVYGGGEMASVGIIDCRVKIDNNATDPVYTEGTDKYVYKNFHSHLDENNGFALSWPFHFENAPGYFGETHVNITGGRIGIANGDTDINTDNGDVYGGGKGIAGEYKNYVYCANVGSAEVTIDYPAGNTATPQNYMTNADIECIAGAVYGGAENGHVMGDTKLTLKNGLIGHSMYGGGSGKGKFSTTLLKIGSTSEHYTRDIYSFTAGKVFGNSTVEMSGGTVVRNVYGGGNMGSVGKGNYAGGADDYSTSGYGEKLSGNLWDNVSKESQAFLTSGICTVNITGGTVGYIDESDPSNSMYPWNSTASLPYGNVFGGCRGESAPNIVETPRYLYSPEFFVGYANETHVTIGAEGSTTGPRILGSVYGGGQDGHIRRDASVTILGGEIGIPFTEANKGILGTDPNNLQWLARGNVYGSGSGIGKYKYDFDYDGKYESTVKYNNGRATVDTKEEDYSTSAGSVTRFTTVDIKGGTIHRNVYGGGSLSSIGAPKIGQSYDPYHPGDSEHSSEVGKQSLNKVTISGGHIGDADCLTSGYGGEVNGGSRGAMAFENSQANPASFANSVYTEVTISDDADVKGNVFGGGEAGIVKHDTEVKMQGGTVGNDLYGAGDMADVNGNTKVLLTGGTVTRDVFGGARGTATIAADVGGDATIELNKQVADDAANAAKMGAVVKGNVFGANNVNGTPKGHVLVHVYGTQNEKTTAINAKVDDEYDVTGVYGGGKSSDYVPDANDTKQSTEVIIEGCDLTSIYEVYGGGYGAATPATDVLIKGTKIIENVFGGGYGASTAGFTNPGANIGYHTDKSKYDLGTGKALVRLMAGTIKNVYGASNTLGDIRGGSNVTNVANDGSAGCCDKLTVGEIYGGGKQADMFGGAEIILGCMPNDWIGAIYAGAENANVGGDVGLTLTSGKFERVFGGNKSGGVIDGYIEVNIEENPDCDTPIIIGELYGGGNEAKYEVPQSYVEKWKNLYGPDADYPSPRVNVRAFTSIGTIFGGGLGKTATVTGNPLVNINEVSGGKAYAGETRTLGDGTTVTLYERKADGKMGVIGNVFGGGNAAPVIGNPRVEVGTAAKQKMLSLQTKDAAGTVHEVEKDVLGADIRGNVYGGGNNAAVTGDPKVVIGQRKE